MNEEATKSAVAAPAAGRGPSAIIGDEGVGKALSEKRRFCQTNPSWATDQSSPSAVKPVVRYVRGLDHGSKKRRNFNGEIPGIHEREFRFSDNQRRKGKFARDDAGGWCIFVAVTTAEAIKLLEKFREGKVPLPVALRAFQAPPVTDLGFAQVDIHRALRKGFAEVIYGAGKTGPQIVKIAAAILKHEDRLLITRLTIEQAGLVRKKFKAAIFHAAARCVTIEKKPLAKRVGSIVVVCAGTSDLPVAEEAVVTADIMGNRVERIYDVGVAGLHRLLNKLDAIRSANVVIVVAGMEGALPSVVAGLVSRPVIAVPTSCGYGTNFGGLTPLLGMLNSCGSGVTVVNIDNGFGAGYAASQINSLSAGGL